MGAKSRQNTRSLIKQNLSRLERQSSAEWDHIEPTEITPTWHESSPSRASPPRSSTRDTETTDAGNAMIVEPSEPTLPLESYALDNPDDLHLSFLKTYPAILTKFPGPPCEALGQVISYMQALFTESPAFHPYITHMPSNNLPSDEVPRARVVEALERRLIQTVQHLFAFFYGDVNSVITYIQRCQAELIPKPLFVVSSQRPEQPTSVARGVENYNNSVSGGAQVWKNPSTQTIWRRHQEQEALRQNLQKCEQAIRRKEAAPQVSVYTQAGWNAPQAQPRLPANVAPVQFQPPMNYPAPFGANP